MMNELYVTCGWLLPGVKYLTVRSRVFSLPNRIIMTNEYFSMIRFKHKKHFIVLRRKNGFRDPDPSPPASAIDGSFVEKGPPASSLQSTFVA
jgi:hypothetical protein